MRCLLAFVIALLAGTYCLWPSSPPPPPSPAYLAAQDRAERSELMEYAHQLRAKGWLTRKHYDELRSWSTPQLAAFIKRARAVVADNAVRKSRQEAALAAQEAARSSYLQRRQAELQGASAYQNSMNRQASDLGLPPVFTAEETQRTSAKWMQAFSGQDPDKN